MPRVNKTPTCLIVAGPNGAGKTTFAKEFLPREGGIIHFVNADLIAAGLSPLQPTLAALQAGRLVLAELDRMVDAKLNFALESTLSGKVYLERIAQWKSRGYRLEMVYLRLDSPEIAIKRIAARVKEGGHHIPSADVRRRFVRSWQNFRNLYLPLCDACWLYDATTHPPQLIETFP